MGKFSGVIAAAKSPENQKTALPESQDSPSSITDNTNEPASRENVKPVRQKTSLPERSKTFLPENQKTSLPENVLDKEVNLSIKVSEKRRMHWLIEAKKQRSSLTREITEFLSQKFGEPTEE